MSEKNAKKGGYKAEDITVLEGLEPVRRRPGMYIGTTGLEGLHHLIWEVFDNSRDEAMGGFADTVEVVLLPGNRVRVTDNGRGIPVDIHKQTKVSALETIMTTLHAGGKFGGGGYKISGGLHGVGVSVVNALSVYVKAEVYRDGGKFEQEYKRGKAVGKVKRIGPSSHNGTIITFEPDSEIFPDIAWNWDKIVSHLRQQAYLVKSFKITALDARKYEGKIDTDKVFYFDELALEAPRVTFYFEGGLASMVKFYNEALKPVHKNIFYVEKTIAAKDAGGSEAEEEGKRVAPKNEEIIVEASLQYVDDISSRELAFANNTYNPEGGTHLTGFRTALTRTLNDYGKKNNIIKSAEDTLSGDDVREGLTAVVSVKMPEVQFEGQTKAKLGSVEARGAVEKVFSDAFGAYLEEHPEDARAILQKVLLALRARKAAKAAKDSILRKGALEGFTLPGKLADCQTKSAEEAELFVVEGDSAGGCFFGDTKVALADGRNVSFKELVKEDKQRKENYCYTVKKNGSIGIALIKNPRLTRYGAQIIKVILDNKEEILCTPDHKFMLRDGAYKEAAHLTPRDSLAPFYRTFSKVGGKIIIEGYEKVHDLMKTLRALYSIYKTDGVIDVEKYNQVRKVTNDKTLIRYDTICQRFFSGDEKRLREAVAQYNHRIKKIVSVSKKTDVYDLEVEGTHNFALASGVFVHNSAKMGRDRRTQAILPLWGKVLNVERARLDKIVAFRGIKELIIALGTAVGETFDLGKLRYHKVIIATDADVDGAHIRTLLLTLFYRYLKPLVEAGNIYIATPPLYKIKVGSKTNYAYSEEEKNRIVKDLGIKLEEADAEAEEAGEETEGEETEKGEEEDAEKKEKKSKVSLQRYKGLGEMNPDELWETTMNPQTRTLKKVTVEDARDADRVFDVLMGTDVPSRKTFIQTHAKEAELDV